MIGGVRPLPAHVKAKQTSDPEADLRLAVGVDVIGVDAHIGAVADGAFDHCRDLGGRAAKQLGVDRHGVPLDVPVDEHPAAAIR